MRHSLQTGIVTAVAVVSLAACGGGGGDASGPPTNQPPPVAAPAAVQDGAFKDANVQGLSFVSGQQSGVTDTAGRYQCETGEFVDFSLGNVTLGSVICSTLTSPPALIGSGAIDDPGAVNMASFLQMLDRDEDPTNGIVISPEIQAVADSWPAIEFTAADFSAELVVPFSDIMSIEQRTPFDLTTVPTLVVAHVEETLSCAYSGAFIGQSAGDSSAAVTMQVGFENYLSNTDDVYWTIWELDRGYPSVFVGYDVQVPPNFDTTPVDPARSVTGRFDDADTISGTWGLPAENLAGTYTVNRIGGNTAETRMNGVFTTDDGGSGVLALDITGDTVTGEAFEATEGTLFTVTGSLDSDVVSIEAVGGGETITGEGSIRRRDRFGLPREVSGNLDVGGSFFARGCKLN